MSSLFEWLVSLGPGPWAFGLAALAAAVFVVVTLSRMYCKFRLTEEDRYLRERIEQARLDIEREHRRDMQESRRKLDDILIRLVESAIDRRVLEDADAEEGDSQG